MTKLTLDQRDALSDVVGSPLWEAIMAVCQIAVENHEIRLLTCDLGNNDRELVLRKARLEGARDVHRSLSNVRELVGTSKKAK